MLPFHKVLRGFNIPTEFNDFMEAFWWALPKEIRNKEFRKNGYKPLRPDQRWAAVYRNLEYVDGSDAIWNLLQNEIGDRIGAKAGKLNSAAKRRVFEQSGLSFEGFSPWH